MRHPSFPCCIRRSRVGEPRCLKLDPRLRRGDSEKVLHFLWVAWRHVKHSARRRKHGFSAASIFRRPFRRDPGRRNLHIRVLPRVE